MKNGTVISKTTTISSIVGELLWLKNSNPHSPLVAVEVMDNVLFTNENGKFWFCNLSKQRVLLSFPERNGAYSDVLMLGYNERIPITSPLEDHMKHDVDSMTLYVMSEDSAIVKSWPYCFYKFLKVTESCIIYDGGTFIIKLSPTDLVITGDDVNVEIINLSIKSSAHSKFFHLYNYKVESCGAVIPHHINLMENEEIYVGILLNTPSKKIDNRSQTEQMTAEQLKLLRKE